MKYLALILVIAGFVPAATGQDIQQSEVPSLVLNTFQSKFPNATDIDWEREADLYKVEFEIGKRDHDLWIDKNGNITKHKEEVTKTDLPAAINQKLQSDFKEYRIDDVDKIETNGKVFFLVDLDSNSGDKEVLFSPDGAVQQGLN